nr:deacetylvindoline O-acetyltransferase [Tanacetum cinerariifolium]
MVATSEEHEQNEYQDDLNEISKEKDDAKPQISANTFGSNGGNDSETSDLETPAKEVVDNGIESEVVVCLLEEFQERDMVDALSIMEQKSLGNWKELDNESGDRKVERDAKREGESTILATFGSNQARITEARFEDERSTTTIIKTNDLNTELPVQDLEEMIRHKLNRVEVVKTSIVATSEELEQQEYQDDLNEISEEKDDAKPPIFIDTFGSNGGNDLETTTAELDNESKDRKVERDAKKEGEPTILVTFGSDRVAAATQQNSGTFKATGMAFPVDMRNILVEKLPGTMVGNLTFMIELPTRNQTELEPHICIGEIRKQNIQFQNIRNLETATGIVAQMTYVTALETSKRIDECYVYSSLCRFPTYRIDFGWGKPVKVTVGGIVKRMTVLMDTPNDDGIKAIVCLPKEDRKTFQRDPELRAFC